MLAHMDLSIGPGVEQFDLDRRFENTFFPHDLAFGQIGFHAAPQQLYDIRTVIGQQKIALDGQFRFCIANRFTQGKPVLFQFMIHLFTLLLRFC